MTCQRETFLFLAPHFPSSSPSLYLDPGEEQRQEECLLEAAWLEILRRYFLCPVLTIGALYSQKSFVFNYFSVCMLGDRSGNPTFCWIQELSCTLGQNKSSMSRKFLILDSLLSPFLILTRSTSCLGLIFRPPVDCLPALHLCFFFFNQPFFCPSFPFLPCDSLFRQTSVQS